MEIDQLRKNFRTFEVFAGEVFILQQNEKHFNTINFRRNLK
jgi:hypothetical protein